MAVSPELLPALVAEAARRSRVCWLTYEYAAGAVVERLVWHQWYDDALVVLSGDDGQRLDGIEEAGSVTVTMRAKDAGTRLVTWTGRTAVVPASTDEWEAHAAALLQVRLNLKDPQATLVRWRQDATIVRVTPTTLAV